MRVKMYDYLTSKVVWIICAMVLISSVFALFLNEKEAIEERKLEKKAEDIAELVNSISQTEGEMEVEVSFNESPNAYFHLKPSLNGDPYHMNFTRYGLFLSQDERSVWAPFVESVHLFNPHFLERQDESPSEVMDVEVPFTVIESGHDFSLRSSRINGESPTFLFDSEEKGLNETINRTRELGKRIQSSRSWDIKDLAKENYSKNITFSVASDLTLHRDFLFSDREKGSIVPFSITKAHLWEPHSSNISKSYVSQKDEEDSDLFLKKGEKLTLSSRLISLEGNQTVMNFIYPADHLSRM